MRERVHSALPAIARPGAFLREALRDIRCSPRGAWYLSLANLRAGRRRSLFGYLWLLVPAAAMAALCLHLQSRRVVEIGPTLLPYALHVFAGMVLWQTFVEAINAPLQQLQGARQLISRSTVPHEALILSGLLDVILNMAIRFAALLVVLAVAGPMPSPGMLLLFPVGLAGLAILGLAIGLLVAPAAMLFEDLRRALPLATTFWLFLSPVLYEVPPTGPLRLNPVTPLIESARTSIVAPRIGWDLAFVCGLAVAAFIGAWLLYRLARPHYVERLG